MKPDKVTESIDYIFKMRKDGQIDQEEAQLVLDAIFSGEMEDMDFELLRLVYLIRSTDGQNEEKLPPDLPEISITISLQPKK